VRVVGIDLGARRIGVAVSDGTGLLASPRGTIERSGDPAADRAAIVAAVEEEHAGRVVVGLPLSLSGRHGTAARAAQAEADELASILAPLGIAVETFDERLTTVTAARSLSDAGRRGPRQRARIDQAAAAVLLQAWLDRQRERDRA
jgi:putative Holliday junction resolvase